MTHSGASQSFKVMAHRKYVAHWGKHWLLESRGLHILAPTLGSIQGISSRMAGNLFLIGRTQDLLLTPQMHHFADLQQARRWILSWSLRRPPPFLGKFLACLDEEYCLASKLQYRRKLLCLRGRWAAQEWMSSQKGWSFAWDGGRKEVLEKHFHWGFVSC